MLAARCLIATINGAFVIVVTAIEKSTYTNSGLAGVGPGTDIAVIAGGAVWVEGI